MSSDAIVIEHLDLCEWCWRRWTRKVALPHGCATYGRCNSKSCHLPESVPLFRVALPPPTFRDGCLG